MRGSDGTFVLLADLGGEAVVAAAERWQPKRLPLSVTEEEARVDPNVQPQMLGFVGLGHMGQPMSAQLVKAGHVVLGFDVAGTRERLPTGAEPATSVDDLAQTANTILLSLPDGRAPVAVCERIAQTDRRTTQTVIDLSTIGIDAARPWPEGPQP